MRRHGKQRNPDSKRPALLRRAKYVVAFAALLLAGFASSTAFGRVLIAGSSTDSITATDPASDSSTTSTDATTTTDTTSTTTESTETTTTATSSSGPPAIVSDQGDYNPGAAVVLRGTGWQPLEVVHVAVNDDIGQTWSYEADATADTNGAFMVQFALPDWFVADYNVTATGSSGGLATTTFSDSAVQNVTVTPSPNTSGANAAYTIKFTPTNAVPSGEFIQVTFPSGTTVVSKANQDAYSAAVWAFMKANNPSNLKLENGPASAKTIRPGWACENH